MCTYLFLFLSLSLYMYSSVPQHCGGVLWTRSLLEHEVCISIKNFEHNYEYIFDLTTINNFENKIRPINSKLDVPEQESKRRPGVAGYVEMSSPSSSKNPNVS